MALGFPKINLRSQPQLIGEAVLAHWQAKVNLDTAAQSVKIPRVAILLKSRDHREYALHEEDMALYSKNGLSWSWTDKDHNGLQARRKDASRVVYRWYPNQKQLFEVFTLSKKSFRFHVESTRIDPTKFVDSLSRFLK